MPDSSGSDEFQVKLRIESKIENPQIQKFLTNLRESRKPEDQLNAFDLITIYSIININSSGIYERSIKLDEGIILRYPKYEYVMWNPYFEQNLFVMYLAIRLDSSDFTSSLFDAMKM